MRQKLGIVNVLICLGWILETAMDAKKAKENDGKINFLDAPLFINNVTEIPGVIKSAPQALLEALEFDGEEAKQVSALVIDKTGCAKENVKAVIINCVGVVKTGSAFAYSMIDLVKSIDELKAPTDG